MTSDMNKKDIIEKTKKYVRKKLEGESSGHDWWHTWRVWRMAKKLAKEERADMFIVELAALLHDVEDWKVYDNKSATGLVASWLKKITIDRDTINQIIFITQNISFKGIDVKNKKLTLEGKIVQDADRLDALGAIGVARTISMGTKYGKVIYNPEIKLSKISRDLRKHKGYSSIHHFYEKILLLKDMMNTKTAKKIAKERQSYIVHYLDRFFKEWEGKL